MSLSVKELADALGKCPHFVYQMRALGFPMKFDKTSRCYVATQSQARSWIDETGFRLVRGRGEISRLVVAKGQP